MLAFSCDSGLVGVIDISTKQVTKMRTLHTNVGLKVGAKFGSPSRRLIPIHKICGTVRFVPNRPSEILSTGYDSALLHFDIAQGSVLSRFDIGEEPTEQKELLIHTIPSRSSTLERSVTLTALRSFHRLLRTRCYGREYCGWSCVDWEGWRQVDHAEEKANQKVGGTEGR
jgi:hypothetical protein